MKNDTHNTNPFAILLVRWDGETNAVALSPDTLLDAEECLRSHLDDRLHGWPWSLQTESEHGHSDHASIYTSDHLEGVTPESSEDDLIAACNSCVVVWDSVGFYVDF